MSRAECLALLPLLVLGTTLVGALLIAAFRRSHGWAFAISVTGLALALLATLLAPSRGEVTPLLVMDLYAAFYMGLIFASAIVVAILSYGFLRNHSSEFDLLLLLATLGSAVLVASRHFASFFLGLEILSVSLYVLISYRRDSRLAIEAGIKYLVLAGTSSAFLLFGMALVFASTGALDFKRVFAALAARPTQDLLTRVSVTMILVGAGFKLAVAPFHMWSPDIYEGAPAPITAFVATASKGAMVALLLRLTLGTHFAPDSALMLVLSILAVASMLVGNFLGLRQQNIKRLLAYSSIAHLGYLLVAVIAGGQFGTNAVAFYLVAYFITTLAAFGVVTVLSPPDREADRISDYEGLYWKRPLLATLFSASLLSLAGIPLTAGFVGKFYLVTAGVSGTLWALVLILVLSSAVGLYYYLRVIVVMFAPLGATERSDSRVPIPLAGSAVLSVLSILLLWLGIYPSPMLHLIQTAMAAMPR